LKAVTVKLLLVWFGWIVTLAGTVNQPLLLERFRVRALVAVLVSDTVQLMEALGLMLAGHDTAERIVAAAMLKVNDCEPPFNEAVNVAD
jgi:hypothetical protein